MNTSIDRHLLMRFDGFELTRPLRKPLSPCSRRSFLWSRPRKAAPLERSTLQARPQLFRTMIREFFVQSFEPMEMKRMKLKARLFTMSFSRRLKRFHGLFGGFKQDRVDFLASSEGFYRRIIEIDRWYNCWLMRPTCSSSCASCRLDLMTFRIHSRSSSTASK